VQLAQHAGIGLHALADPLDDHRAGQAREGQVALAVTGRLAGRVLVVELREPRDRIAVGRAGRPAEQLPHLGLDRVAHHVLPTAGLLVRLLVGQPDDVDQQELGEPVLAHHRDGVHATGVGEVEVPVALDPQQPVALHPV